jgi:hypothetical protein
MSDAPFAESGGDWPLALGDITLNAGMIERLLSNLLAMID